MALKPEGPFLLFAALCALAVGYLFLIYPHAPRKTAIYNIETTMTWDGPNVKLDEARLRKLNDELDAMLDQELPGRRIHYPVISLDKKWVEVMYIGDGPLPEPLQQKLDAHIKQRLPELAREQVFAP